MPDSSTDPAVIDIDGWGRTVFKGGPVVYRNDDVNARITVERTVFDFGPEAYVVIRHIRDDEDSELWPVNHQTAEEHDVAHIIRDNMEDAEAEAR